MELLGVLAEYLHLVTGGILNGTALEFTGGVAHVFLQEALQFEVCILDLLQQAVLGIPQTTVGGFQQTAGHLLQGPGIVLHEELTVLLIGNEGFGNVVEDAVLHRVGGGIPAVDTANTLADVARALITGLLLALDPLGIQQLAGNHTIDLFTQCADLHTGSLTAVAVIGADIGAGEILCRSGHAAVVCKVTAAAQQIMLIGHDLVVSQLHGGQVLLQNAHGFLAEAVSAVGVLVIEGEQVANVALLLPGRGVDQQIDACGVGTGLGTEETGGGIIERQLCIILHGFQRMLADEIHVLRLVQGSHRVNSVIYQIDAVLEVITEDTGAVVLSVGLVVDDAIVMTENIYIRIEQGMRPFRAGIEGAKEIFFAVISTTITLVAVFLPIVFMEGTSGRLFREFSFVVAGSVIISSFAALTFTPMLATKILKRRKEQNKFYKKTEPFFAGMNNIYEKSLAWFLERRVWAIPITIVMFILIAILWNNIPAEMAPLEDRSQITINTRGAEGASYEFMRDYTEEINTLIDSIVPDAESVTARVSSGSGNIRITLKDLSERDYSQMDVAAKLSQAVSTKTKARAFVQQQSSFGGRRGSMPVQYVLQAVSIEKLQDVLPEFLSRVHDNPTFQMADVDLKFSSPEVRVNINRDKAGTLGASVRDVAETLQYGLSGQRMGYFYMNGKQYEIIGQINRQQRNTPSNIKSLYIRSDKGEMIQFDNLVEFVESVAPPKLYHYNRFISATISAGLSEGKTIGEGLDEMDKIAEEVLDETFRTALSGDSKEYRESSSSLMFAFILALVLIYLILAAQFESFKDPFVIMLTVPLAIAGALVFMYFTGITMNIFSQIGIIMLIGLVAKNGILIVEFANQKQESGEEKMSAIKSASLQRLRPILMTSVSTMLGLLPLAFASGEGANQRIAMGTAVIGGMLVSTILTMYIVPAIYSYISTERKKDEE